MLHIIYFSETAEPRELSYTTLPGLTREAGTQSTNQITQENTFAALHGRKTSRYLLKKSSPSNSKEGFFKKKGSSINKKNKIKIKRKVDETPILLRVSLW